MVGTIIALAIFSTLPFFYLLPLPAFIDWGTRKLNFFESGKTVGFITGIPLGLSYPSYFFELLNFDSYALISALFYIAVFAGIHIIGNLKAPSA